jgi:hypothetical protein
MLHSTIKTDQVDAQNERLSREALQAAIGQMKQIADPFAGVRLEELFVEAINNVPARLHNLVLSGRAVFAPVYDEQGHLIEVSIVPDEKMPE